jgi:quercetin dioxygenase-like cupin family protein
MTLDEQLKAAGVEVVHHFVGGLYAKETRIPAGVTLTQHRHKFDHLSALMQGEAVVMVDGQHSTHTAPALITIRAGLAHEVTALTDVVWACLHATDALETDDIDAMLIAEGN